VSGAKANDLGLEQVPDEVKQERYHRFMEAQQEISSAIFQSKVGREIDVLVDSIDLENEEAVARSPWDAPEIDGNVFLPGETSLKPGDKVRVRIVEAEEYDLVGELL
jgi:ribosomal protein S12 methylthiotransferase